MVAACARICKPSRLANLNESKAFHRSSSASSLKRRKRAIRTSPLFSPIFECKFNEALKLCRLSRIRNFSQIFRVQVRCNGQNLQRPTNPQLFRGLRVQVHWTVNICNPPSIQGLHQSSSASSLKHPKLANPRESAAFHRSSSASSLTR